MEKLLERLAALVAFRQECAERLTAITDIAAEDETRSDGRLNEAEEAEFDQLAEWVTQAREEETSVEARLAVFEAANTPSNVTRGDSFNINVRTSEDPFDVRDASFMTTTNEWRGRAMKAVEQMDEVEDDTREAAFAALKRVGDKTGALPRRMLATGSTDYRSAFAKVISDQQYSLTENERQALARAASLTNAEGGFAVPFTLDPTIILTNAGSASPYRQISRVVQTATDSWNGVSSAGVTAAYAAEASEVGDDAPTLAQPSIPVHRADAFVPFSFEVGSDWASFQSDIFMMFNDARDNLEATAFSTGSGSDAPTGIRTELLAGASEVDTATAEVLVLADVSGTYAALPPRHRNPNTAAIAEWSTLVEIRRLLAAAGDRSSFNEATATMPATLYGWPIFEASGMDAFSDVDAAASAVSNLLTVGDFSRNFVIVDRVGMNVELVPHLFATGNNRPSGQRGYLAWWRNGAESVNDDGFRALTLTTTA